MADVVQNTLYVTTQGAYVHREGQVLQVEIEKEVKLGVPIHHLQSVVLFGNVMISPAALHLCAENTVAVSFLTENGRLQARVDAPGSGNVLLRREQFRRADTPAACADIARGMVTGKILNARALLQRSARESDVEDDARVLDAAVSRLEEVLRALPGATDLETIRGQEGMAAKVYFGAFSAMIRRQREHFRMQERTRRPPLDPLNALLSFVYAVLLHDCAAALTAAGLDPSVGFLHVDRPGRPSLALDLLEEFRPLIADRLVLALINRKQVTPQGFVTREGGAVEMSEETRKTVLTAYQQRKQEVLTHPLLAQSMRVGMLPFVQARLLARHLRGDIPAYPPCVLR